MALCAAAGVGLSCQGDCFPDTPVDPVPPPSTVALATRYVLVSVSGGALPRVIRQDADGTIVRVFADTLTLDPGGTADRGTFDEVAVLGTIRPGQAEVVTRGTATGRAYTRQPYNALSVTGSLLLAGAGSGGVMLRSGTSSAATNLSLYGGTTSLLYESR